MIEATEHIRVHLPMWGTQFGSLIWEDPIWSPNHWVAREFLVP